MPGNAKRLSKAAFDDFLEWVDLLDDDGNVIPKETARKMYGRKKESE